MRAVGLKVLKNRLSEYVRLASGGETILVTDRNRVVAELVPPREGRSAVLQDALLLEAVRKGWLTPALTAFEKPPSRLPVGSTSGASCRARRRPWRSVIFPVRARRCAHARAQRRQGAATGVPGRRLFPSSRTYGKRGSAAHRRGHLFATPRLCGPMAPLPGGS